SYNKESKELVQIISELSKARSLQTIMDIVKERSRRLVNSDGVTFILKEGNSCYYADENAISSLWKGKKFPMQFCISGWSMIHKKSVVIPDIYQDSRIPIEAYKPTFVKSLAMIPIRISDPVGAIGHYWAKPYTASEQDLELLQALTETVSVAIENVNLYNSQQNQIAELRSLNKSKDEFLMVLSHELRTPLNSILGWSKLLKSNSNYSDSDLLIGIDSIERNARSQSSLINDLLDTSLIITGKFSLNKEEINLMDSLNSSIKSIKVLAEEKKLNFSLSTFANIVEVFADPKRLEQVFDNILSNAIKFSQDYGKIQIRIDREQSFIRIQFIDEGIGIEADFLPFLFDRFQQADSSTTRHSGGLGLGLSIVKYIVEAHGGQIKAESLGLKKGSTFTVYIPEILVGS
ncbi:MAG: GAF domain-containing sensor histidine kinase, partial [Bdellovibrionaceae bacterium]|nr:GAF domain-containing sensor histidine kinase [Pseudobdellovibrionaceae bacterium]